MPNVTSPRIAYFSMEIALDPSIPTYSGGLGILAGDTLRSAADLGVPIVGVTLLHRKGYFEQDLDELGTQSERPSMWEPEEAVEPTGAEIQVTIEGRPVTVHAWRYSIRGASGHVVPVILLDTSSPENDPWDQTLTDYLYGGDSRYRLCQEVVLGMGGLKMLCQLGMCWLETYHMNEGHAALVGLALAEQRLNGRDVSTVTQQDLEDLRRRCIFTTHTPVPAGHDQFERQIARQVLGDGRISALEKAECFENGTLNMTYVALKSSHYVNGVAMRHGEVSRGMFPNYPIRAITNGVHAATWAAAPFRRIFDRHFPEWRDDNLYLRYAVGIPLEEIRQAHVDAKAALIEEVKKTTGLELAPSVMTIGFARRAAAYKRADLLFADLDRLKWMARRVGPLQIVYAGKAHPRDAAGKELIRHVVRAAAQLKDYVRVVYVPNYNWRWGQLIASGVDLWLNTPQRPHEASGPSGMKAALNGWPSLSVLDGWWVEGHVEGVTGWAIGQGLDLPESDREEVASLYEKLESVILPMFYGRTTAYSQVMRWAIALNGSFFNTDRMLRQYLSNAYFPKTEMNPLRPSLREPASAPMASLTRMQ